MKLKKVSIPDNDVDLTSDLTNLKTKEKGKAKIGATNADKCKVNDRKIKLRNNNTNVQNNSKNKRKSSNNGAETSEHNPDMVSDESKPNSAQANTKSNGENAETTTTKHFNSKCSTVTLLGQSVERLQATVNRDTNSYKDNDDLDDSNPGSLLVENTAARRNGTSYSSAYLDPFKDDKDCSSSSCSSPIHDLGNLEDDSEDMVLRISEDESGTFATSPTPSASVNMLLNQRTKLPGGLFKPGDAHLSATNQEQINNLPSIVPRHTLNILTSTKSFGRVDKITNATVSAVDTESSTDKCSLHSDDNFDDLLSNMSSKEIELTKKKNDGVTVSDLQEEIVNVLNTSNSMNPSEVNEKPVRNTDGSTKNAGKSVNNANGSLASKNDEITSASSNSKHVQQTPDTKVTSAQVKDAMENEEVTSDFDMESVSGSTIVLPMVRTGTGTNRAINDYDDDDYYSLSTDVDSAKDDFSLVELLPESPVVDGVSKSETRIDSDEAHSSDKQRNDEQNTSELEDSDESIKILTISATINETSDTSGLDTTTTDTDLKSKETLADTDKNEIVEEGDDKVKKCAVANDSKIDDAEDNTEGAALRASLKRSHEKSDDNKELKKQKTLDTRVETEESKTEQLGEVQKTSTQTSATEKIGKRTVVKEENDELKRAKIDTKPPLRNLEYFREFMMRKGIRRLSRQSLEEFTIQKMCEAINQNSQMAELVRELRIKDMALESIRMKYTTLQKQVTDLDIVQSRISNEMRKVKDPREVVPVKITRSVGLQVSLQPLKTKVTIPAPAPHVTDPLVPITPSVPLKKKHHRASAGTNRASMLPPPPPALTPAPAHVRQPPVPTGKGIKTILPKISNNVQTRDETNSLLGNILQKSPTTNNNATGTTSPRRPSGDSVKVIDLTDEDDSNRASTSAQSASGNIRIVAPHQLTNTSTDAVSPLVTTGMPRLTYLVQSPGQQGQSVLLATTNVPTRPGQARPTLMFKPVVPQGAQKLNLVRPAVPGTVAVLPSTLGNSTVCKYVTTYAPGPLTRSPTLTTRAIAPAPRHPAPLPGPPAVQASQPSWKLLPPKPSLKITLVGDGIVLSWRILNKDMSLYEEIASYQLYAYQETNAPPTTDMWRKVGDVKALALPMACTLTQFTDGNKYHFAVRGVDVKTRVGPFSTPEQITLPAQ